VSVVLVHLVLVTIHDTFALDTLCAVGVTDIAAEPLGLATPVDGLVRLEGVGASTGEAKGWAVHGLEGDVAREENQVGP
jgi:hypothetical protein